MTSLDPQLRIANLERELQWAHLKIQVLEERLRQQRIRMLGPRSETLSDLQLELLADEEPGVTREEVEAESRREPIHSVAAREGKTERRPHPGRQRLPEKLERVEQVLACEDRNCRQCGAETALLGYDESEQLDVEPARYFVRVIKREKRACRKCANGGVTAAPLPERIVEKGLASDRVVIQTVVAKYSDHLPLYRQAAMLEREAGLRLPDQKTAKTICDALDLDTEQREHLLSNARSGTSYWPTSLERVTSYLKQQQEELGATSITFYVRDPYWTDEFQLIAMPNVVHKETMHGLVSPEGTKSVLIQNNIEFCEDAARTVERRDRSVRVPGTIAKGLRPLFGESD